MVDGLGNDYGYIHYYDLCRDDPRRLPLISPRRGDRGSGQRVETIVISVDLQSPTLQFTVAFVGRSEALDQTKGSFTTIDIIYRA